MTQTAADTFAFATKGETAIDFTRPVPSLSARNTILIRDDLLTGNYDYVVEYGLGWSTFYFFDALRSVGWKGRYIAVENQEDWFDTCVSEARRRYGVHGTLTKTPWPMADIRTFLDAPITPDSKGLPEFQRKLRERIFGFGKTTFANRVARKLRRMTNGKLTMLEYAMLPNLRPKEATWTGANLTLALSSMPGADQYGESPFRDRYVACGTNVSGKVAVMIDGGPRAHVLTTFLGMEDRLKLTIYLQDAQRPFFDSFTALRPTGEYLDGNGITLAGNRMYDDPRKNVREVWRYRNH